MADKNPIAARLDQLHDQWTRFVEREEARVLLWSATDEEAPLIDAFVARECEPESAQTPDLFLQLSAPFAGEAGHGFELGSELIAQYEEASQGADATSPMRPWRCPSSTRQVDDVNALVRALASLRAHLTDESSPPKLTVWLAPDHVSSWEAYQLWLQRLAQRAPASLRFIVVDRSADPQCEPLAKAEPRLVHAKACDLRVLPALEELASAAGPGTPGGAFRFLQAQFAERLGARDFEAAVRKAASAVELATAQGWPQLGAVVQMMLGAAYSAEQRPHEALTAYGEAERMGALWQAQTPETASASEATLGSKIRMQARLGQGAVLLACHAFEHAAQAYEQSALLAHDLGDAPAELDSCRLASVCHSELGNAEAAWELGARGFQLGLDMDEQTRRSSTLPYLADHLVRLTERHTTYRAHRRPLEEQLTRLLGPQWRQQLVEAC